MFIEVPASNMSTSNRRALFGIGINDADYKISSYVDGKLVFCPYYMKWKDMICRCYSTKVSVRQLTYKDCTVTDDWLTFSSFKVWMKKQNWKGNELDKDILKQGNKIYSPSTYLFVSRAVNMLLNDNKASRGDFPVGVSINKNTGKFRARFTVNGKEKHIGTFDTQDEAYDSYKLAKYESIRQVAVNQGEPLKSALLNYKIGQLQ